jgi:hypothetical protein
MGDLEPSTAQFLGSTYVFEHLHWLPVQCEIAFEHAKLMCLTNHSTVPGFLSQLVAPVLLALYAHLCSRADCVCQYIGQDARERTPRGKSRKKIAFLKDLENPGIS